MTGAALSKGLAAWSAPVLVYAMAGLLTSSPLGGFEASRSPEPPGPSAAQSASSETSQEMEVLDERAGQGEQCLVCGAAVHGDPVVEVRYKGRRFFVRQDMVDTFVADPDSYFRTLEARSALFDEHSIGTSHPAAGNGWLFSGLYVLLGLVMGALCSYIAVGRGRSPWPWFAGGFLFNVAALLALLGARRGDLSAWPAGIPVGLAKVPTTRAPGSCPHCGAPHHPAADECGACGRGLERVVDPETERV